MQKKTASNPHCVTYHGSNTFLHAVQHLDDVLRHGRDGVGETIEELLRDAGPGRYTAGAYRVTQQLHRHGHRQAGVAHVALLVEGDATRTTTSRFVATIACDQRICRQLERGRRAYNLVRHGAARVHVLCIKGGQRVVDVLPTQQGYRWFRRYQRPGATAEDIASVRARFFPC